MLGRNFAKWPVLNPVAYPVRDGQGGAASFCPLQTYSDAGTINAICSQQIVDGKPEFTTESTALGGFNCIFAADISFNMEGGNTWVESTVKSSDSAACGGGLSIDSGGAFADGIIGFGFDTIGGGTIHKASDFSVIASGLTLTLPWTVQLRIDGTTGEMTWIDNQPVPNFGSLGIIPALITADLFIRSIAGGQGAYNVGDTVVLDLNAAYLEPIITPPVGYVGFCDLGRAELCGTLVGLDYIFGDIPTDIILTQNDINFSIENQQANISNYGFQTYETFNFPANAGFVELTFDGASLDSPDNQISASFSLLLGLIGFGFVVIPNRQSGSDGALLLSPEGRRILGEQITITDVDQSGDEITITHVSGGDTNGLGDIGFNVVTSTIGSVGVSDSILESEGQIRTADYTITPFIFDVQLGANPAVQISLTGSFSDATVIAASMQSALQGTGGVYANMTVGKTADGIDIQDGYSVWVGYSASTLELAYLDSLGNSDVLDLNVWLGPIAPLVQPLSLPYMAVGQIAGGIGETLEFSYNAGKYEPLLTVPAGYKGHCNIGLGQRGYFYNQLIFIGGGDISQINNGRTRVLTNNIAESETPNTVDVFGDFAFSPTVFTINCFESEITFIEAGVLKEEFAVGLNAVLSTDLRLTRDGYSGNELKLQSQFPNLNDIFLSNSLPDYAAGDASALCVFNIGAPDIPPLVQFVIKAGASLVIYDKLAMVAPDPQELPYTAFTQSNKIDFPTNDNTPDGNSAEITFNGIDGDYSITDYPDDFLDNNGQAMPLSTSPWTRSAFFSPFYVSGSDQTVSYSNSDKTINILNGASVGNLKGHLPLFVPFGENESILVGFKADIVNGDFRLESNVIQLESSKIVIEQVGADVRYQVFNEFGQPSTTGNLATGYTIKNNDLIYIQFRNSYVEPVVVSKADLFLWDELGSQIYKQIDVSYAGSNNSPLPTWSSILLAGFENIPVGTTSQLTSQCKSADMDSNITSQPEISVGAIDIEGNLV